MRYDGGMIDRTKTRRFRQKSLSIAMVLFNAPLVFGADAPLPLWDVAEYAVRVNLPPTKTLDLGGGVKLELVLIPAGKKSDGAFVQYSLNSLHFFSLCRSEREIEQFLSGRGNGLDDCGDTRVINTFCDITLKLD